MSILNYYYSFLYKLQKRYWDNAESKSPIHGLVLMFHHISDVYLDELDSCQHTTNEFKEVLAKVKSEGYIFVSIKQALEIIKERKKIKFAVVTFDDVPKNALVNGVPFLLENSIPFTFFITTGFLDKEGYLTKDELVDLNKSPLCTIGAHTVNHSQLRKVSNAYEELYESKVELEKIVGEKVDYLAYPYGRHSSVSFRVMKLAKKAGFRCAFGTVQSSISDVSAKNFYFLPRVVIK